MINRFFNLPRSIVVACAAVTALFGARLIGADALTQHYNNARTGAVLDETKLTTGTVNTAGFGKLWTLYADGQIVAQPLYVSGLEIDTSGNPQAPLVQGTFNTVIVATMHNPGAELSNQHHRHAIRSQRPGAPVRDGHASIWSHGRRCP